MSEGIVQEFLAQGLLATSLSWPHFQALVTEANEKLSSHQIAYVYQQLKIKEEEFVKRSQSRIQEHLIKIRSNARDNLEATQLKSTVSVEDLVNTLYSAHQLFDDRTTQLNSDINAYTQKLRIIEEEMRPLKDAANIQSIQNRLENLVEHAKKAQS
ncbi:Nkp2p LALA0_S04e00408g [Lachancea lanzarotensis]|uniref:LALA0S04e00408g1_1 n=1 Tax=Lachancea lanzarotensis TaxID=1245769 RepID=A0A0C7N8L8_9SACH|nr:uncharacterized protein LALA0_S04e00408g [Lachancea lanzarotensis]CEP61777.1 LALA0S04e00408g1_1 [Lachancea lanzarotensis]